jgi:isopentenyldiphosphate isomerase
MPKHTAIPKHLSSYLRDTTLEVPESGIRDFEFQQSFRTVYGGQVSPDVAEVMETRAVNPEELEAEFVRHPEAFTPWFRQRAEDLELFLSWEKSRCS